MKALVLEEIKNLRLVDKEKPTCNKTEVLLKVRYCSVCRTDAKMWFQGQRDLVLPRVLGHEICGQKLDSDIQYVVWPANTCKKCPNCKAGIENLCDNIEVIGFHRDGGLAQYIKVPKESLIEVPKTIPPEIACMTELLSAAVNAIEQVALQKKQKMLIFGGGPAGLMLGLACKFFGTDPFIVENNSGKREKIKLFCKNANIHLTETTNTLDRFDVAINAAPDLNILPEGLLKLNSGGKFCLFSGFTKNINFPSDLLNEVHYRQLTIIGAYGSTKRQMEIALKILEVNVQTIKLLIHKIIDLKSVPLILPKVLQGQALKYVVDLHKGEENGN
ncbi:MAG: alcohol dehydrogenase catalytic domain-containing protein [Nitrososphaerota archaeon]|jgi:threonine dehydrogenase-like Zn-dependent dehydrogenase|nr:alcohol dehydrogenase catalytic domain-containing protein [Nitrososphaerota archaeon]